MDKDCRFHQICPAAIIPLELELLKSGFLTAVPREPAPLLASYTSWFSKGAEKLHQPFVLTFPTLRGIKKFNDSLRMRAIHI